MCVNVSSFIAPERIKRIASNLACCSLRRETEFRRSKLRKIVMRVLVRAVPAAKHDRRMVKRPNFFETGTTTLKPSVVVWWLTVFGSFRFQISARRPLILTDVF
jgi:hypothetical protein